MSSFLLVPGACHGGWWYDPLVALLERDGHRAHAVTLAGLEPEPELHAAINLDTHIQQAADAAAQLARTQPQVVLVGHSYGGSVITGVADRMPGQISALVYLDAFVPHDGDSCWAMAGDEGRAWYLDAVSRSGYGLDPLPHFDARARPHPIATFLQTSRLTGAWRQVPVKIHVEAIDWAGASPMAAAARRAREDAGFTAHRWATRHNVMHDGPDRVHELIRAL